MVDAYYIADRYVLRPHAQHDRAVGVVGKSLRHLVGQGNICSKTGNRQAARDALKPDLDEVHGW